MALVCGAGGLDAGEGVLVVVLRKGVFVLLLGKGVFVLAFSSADITDITFTLDAAARSERPFWTLEILFGVDHLRFGIIPIRPSYNKQHTRP